MKEYSKIERVLLDKKDRAKAKKQERFFKTAPGDYGEGDQFLGIPAPELHRLSQEWVGVQENTVAKMMKSPWHEERLLALLIVRRKYNASASKKAKRHFGQFYLSEKEGINSWDLVDMSAPYILGQETREGRFIKERKDLLHSRRMWDRRIAIVSTLALIRRGRVDDTLKMAQDLLRDTEDLIHKASGWMLREVGKENKAALYSFLDSYATRMPRTMLRYSLERIPEGKRRYYMNLS